MNPRSDVKRDPLSDICRIAEAFRTIEMKIRRGLRAPAADSGL